MTSTGQHVVVQLSVSSVQGDNEGMSVVFDFATISCGACHIYRAMSWLGIVARITKYCTWSYEIRAARCLAGTWNLLWLDRAKVSRVAVEVRDMRWRWRGSHGSEDEQLRDDINLSLFSSLLLYVKAQCNFNFFSNKLSEDFESFSDYIYIIWSHLATPLQFCLLFPYDFNRGALLSNYNRISATVK